jgi:hypothetical protein
MAFSPCICMGGSGVRSVNKNQTQKKKEKKEKNYSTEYSHVVPHHSTDSAIDCLTSQIGRDAVGLVVYGRSLEIWLSHPVYVWVSPHVKKMTRGV